MAASMLLNDNTRPMRGIFSMRTLDSTGRVLSEYSDKNMIVNGARLAMAMLVGEGSSDKVITGFAVGTGSAVATPTDTTLTEMYSNAIVSHEYPSNGVVKFIWRLGYDESNDRYISEFGLLCADGSLFSRKVREPIYKASDIAFEGEWSIIF